MASMSAGMALRTEVCPARGEIWALSFVLKATHSKPLLLARFTTAKFCGTVKI